MALAIDASTPTVASWGKSTTVTCASFSPPAGSVIFAFIAASGCTPTTSVQSIASVTDSLSALTWTLYSGSQDNTNDSIGDSYGTTEVWYAPCPTAQTNITVTATVALPYVSTQKIPAGLLQIVVFTGAATTQNGSATILNNFNAVTPSLSITTSANNSWVFGVLQNNSNGTTPTFPSGQTDVVNSVASAEFNALQNPKTGFWTQLQTSTTPTASTSVTLNITAPTSLQCHFSVVEVLPTISASAPTVTTTAVSGITATAATGNGNVTSDGGGTITERGIVWGTSVNPTTASSKATASGTTGTYTASMTSLSANTFYHVRAYATNSAGTSYGSDVTFTNYQVSSGGGSINSGIIPGWLHH